jgi:non-heme chloroperoxidase
MSTIFATSDRFNGLKQTIRGPQNIPLYFETYGNPSAERTLVFIHGALQALHCWRRQYPLFAQEHYVVGLDLPWHGQSNPVAPEIQPTSEIWGQCVHAVLKALNLEERPVIPVVWSLAGLVMLSYLKQYGSAYLQGLVSVASLIGNMQAYMPYLPSAPVAPILPTMLSADTPFAEKSQSVTHFVDYLTFETQPLEEYYYTYGYNARSFSTASAILPTLLAGIDGTEGILENLAVPTLLIQGMQDALVLPHYTREIARTLPRATLLEYDACGHSPFLENSERFNWDVQTFVHNL